MSKARELSAFVSTPAAEGSAVKLKEGSDNGTNFIELKSPAALSSDVTLTFPNSAGSNGQALTTDGSGGLSWATVGGTPGGSDTQIQYNSGGSFAGASGLVTDGSNLTINAQGDLRFADSDSSNWVAFQAPATVASNVTWTLPNADGTSGQVLSTNGSGTLSWASGAPGGSSITAGDSKVEVTDTGSNGTIVFNTDNAERMRITSAGYVGIGKTPVNKSLEIYAASDTALRIQNSTTGTANTDGLLIEQGGVDSYFVNYENGNMLFFTNNTERARIASTGELLVGKTSVTANGGVVQVSNGITFPATQSASTNANTLDDYEEGSWTPTLDDGYTRTYSQQVGYYTKIGNIVVLNGLLSGSARSGASSARSMIKSLPFNPIKVNLDYPVVVASVQTGGFTVSNQIISLTPWWDAGAALEIRPQTTSGTTSTPTFDGSNIAASFWISFTVVYRIA